MAIVGWSPADWPQDLLGPLETFLTDLVPLHSPVLSATLPEHLVSDYLEENRFLYLRVDTREPVETVLPLVEAEIRAATRKRPPRRRLDQVSFQLDVYDRSVAGQTFREIARTLKRRPTTVKSAYLAARRNIGLTTPVRKRDLPRATFDWSSFDPETHYRDCKQCKTAATADEMCLALRLYATQDQRGQQHLLGYDTVRS